VPTPESAIALATFRMPSWARAERPRRVIASTGRKPLVELPASPKRVSNQVRKMRVREETGARLHHVTHWRTPSSYSLRQPARTRQT
jgi:hypothetical protein